MSPNEGPTPGRQRVYHFTVNGKNFGFRRPSRADERDVTRLYATKTTGIFGTESERTTIEAVDGERLRWEAYFEVCLIPRNGKDLGEFVPPDWMVAGAPTGMRVMFDDVDPEEFDAVVAAVDTEVFKKKASTPPPGPSGSSVADQTSA